MKILVVDDSVSVRKALERILSTRKLGVIATGSAEEALERLPTSNVSLVIADVVMPGMDGFALCRELKADARYAHLPVLLISGIVNQDVERQAEEVGAAGIAKKPFTPDELFPKIEAALASAAPAPETDAETSADGEPESEVAAEHVVPAAAPQTVLSQSEALTNLLRSLLSNAAIHAALFADTQGACLAQVGRGLDDGATLAVYSRTLASVAGALGEHIGLTGGADEGAGLNGLHLDYQGQSLLITKVATRGTLLLRIKDASSIGVVRYLVRKFIEEEAQLSGSPVLAS